MISEWDSHIEIELNLAIFDLTSNHWKKAGSWTYMKYRSDRSEGAENLLVFINTNPKVKVTVNLYIQFI